MSSYWLSFATFTHPRVPSIRLGLLILFYLLSLVWFKLKHLKGQLGPALVKSRFFRSKVVSWGPASVTRNVLIIEVRWGFREMEKASQVQKFRCSNTEVQKQNCFNNVSLTHLNQFSFPIGVRNCTQIHLGVLSTSTEQWEEAQFRSPGGEGDGIFVWRTSIVY